MLKRITSFLIVLLLLTGITTVSAASSVEFTASSDNEQGVINISGTAPANWGSRKIAIMVGRPTLGASVNYDTLSEAEFLAGIYTVSEAVCNADGSFSAQIRFDNNAALGYYLIRVGATGIASDTQNDKKVLYATKTEALGILSQLNQAASGAAMQAVIDGVTTPGNLPHAEILSLDVTDVNYSSHKATFCEYLYALKGTGYSSLAALQQGFLKSSLLTEITYCNREDTISKIESSAQTLGINITMEEYTNNKAATAELVKSNIALLPSYTTTPEKFFAAMSTVAAINFANRETVMGIVERNAAQLDIVLGSDYTSLSSYEVGKALVGQNFTTVKAVSDALTSRIQELISQKNQQSPIAPRPMGGGGGGGGAGISNPTPIQPIQPYEEPNATDNGTFRDVTTSHWAYEAIKSLSDKGIINGMGDGIFAPGGSVTREQIAKMVVLSFDLAGNTETFFSDVDSASWYAPFVATAMKNGIVNGVGNGEYGVGREVTRQDLMVMLYRALSMKGYNFSTDVSADFSDMESVSEYAKDAVTNLYGAGIVNGTDGKIEPVRICSRAEAAKLIFETISKLQARMEAGIYEN